MRLQDISLVGYAVGLAATASVNVKDIEAFTARQNDNKQQWERGDEMRQPANMCTVYNMISRNMGKRVLVRTNQGRNRYDEAEGFIEEMHPHVFCVRLDSEEESVKTVSYSYTDVLIRDVELVF